MKLGIEIHRRLTLVPGNRIEIVRRIGWLGVGVLWGGLLFFVFGATISHEAPRVMAKMRVMTAEETPTIAFSSTMYTFTEGINSGNVTLLVNPAGDTPVTVTVSSSNMQATAPEDFDGLRQALVISPDVLAENLTLVLIDDGLVEGNEQLRLTLSNVQGATLGAITETVVTILDNDFVFMGVSDTVADEGAGSVAIVITQSSTSTLESVVDYRTLEGSATSPEDYVERVGSATIPPGQTQTSVTLNLTVDDEGEPVENFFFQLEHPLNAELADMTATVTIVDDDLLPELDLAGASASESDSILPFVVTLSNTWLQTVTVAYTTKDGSAIAPGDYLASTGELVIPPGHLTATVPVALVHDQVDEPDETMTLQLADPVQVILAITQAQGTIHNDPRHYLFLPGVGRNGE